MLLMTPKKWKVYLVEHFDMVMCQLGLQTLLNFFVALICAIDPAEKVTFPEMEHKPLRGTVPSTMPSPPGAPSSPSFDL